jgi:hypothetical protein
LESLPWPRNLQGTRRWDRRIAVGTGRKDERRVERNKKNKMNLVEFQLFLKAHIDGQAHAAGHFESQAGQLQENLERIKAEQQVKMVTGCGGSSTRRLRQWFLDVELSLKGCAPKEFADESMGIWAIGSAKGSKPRE